MKNLKIFSLIFLITSCSSSTSFLTDKKEGWFRDHDLGLVYCQVTTKSDGLPDPVCVEVGFVRERK